MARFLADENVPGAMVRALRSAGHDVACIAETTPGLPDRDVLARASAEVRILLSFDKDFGDLARHERLSAASGIVLMRLPKPASIDAASQLVSVLGSRRDWSGHFSVIEPGRIRQRRLLTT